MPSIIILLIGLAVTADVTVVAVQDEVRAAQAARIQATIDADVDALEAIYAADLVYTHSDGRVDDRLVLLNALASGRVDYQAIDIVAQTIRVIGDVAIINGTADFRVQAGAQMNEMTLRFTSIYVRGAQGWQFSSWHSSRVPDAS